MSSSSSATNRHPAIRTVTRLFLCGNGEWGCGQLFEREYALQEHQKNTVTGDRCMEEKQQWESKQEGSQIIPQPRLSFDICSSLRVDSRLYTPDTLDSLDLEYSSVPGAADYELTNVPEIIMDDIAKRVCSARQLSEFPLPWQLSKWRAQTTVFLIESEVKDYFVEFITKGKHNECIYILDRCLSLVARDELAWMLEFLSLGLPLQNLVEILMQESHDQPWTQSSWKEAELGGPHFKYRDPDRTFHRTGCPHLHGRHDALTASTGLEPRSQNALHQRRVSQVCGLAGIHDVQIRFEGRAEVKYDRGGDVSFSFDDSEAQVEYPFDDDFTYMLESVKRVCDAVAGLQAAGLCCNGWTVIVDSSRTPNKAYAGENAPLLQMRRFYVSQVQRLRRSLRRRNLVQISYATRSILSTMAEAEDPTSTDDHLRTIFDDFEDEHLFATDSKSLDPSDLDASYTKHLAAFAVQVLSLSLVSFASSHVGTLELDCLVEDLKQVTLVGRNLARGLHVVEMKLQHLTCLEGLFGKAVRVFSISKTDYICKRSRKHDHEHESLDWQRYHLRATPEDLVDTFGGALFSIEGSVDSDTCLAFSLAGGIVAPTFTSASEFHWSSGLHLQYTPRCFRKAQMITVGALSENKHCCQDPDTSRNQASTRLQGLGTHKAFWEFQEIAIGVQMGQYINPTVTANFSRVAEMTLKEVFITKAIARNLNWPELEKPMGLQISSCTGLARRVPLCVVLADSLIHTIESKMSYNTRWAELVNDHEMMRALYASSLQSWSDALPDHLKDLARDILCDQVVALAKTGINSRSGVKHMMVAWPSKESPDACIPIDLGHEANLWAKILLDSPTSATFACITNACLEGSGFRCPQTPTLGATGIVRMLSTGLYVSSDLSWVPFSASLATLEAMEIVEGRKYVIGPEKQRLVATVQRVHNSPPGHIDNEPTLMISKSKIPWYIWRRARVLKPLQRLYELGAFVPPHVGRAVSILSRSGTGRNTKQLLSTANPFLLSSTHGAKEPTQEPNRTWSSSPILHRTPKSPHSPNSSPSQSSSTELTVPLTVSPRFPKKATLSRIPTPMKAICSRQDPTSQVSSSDNGSKPAT